MNKSRKKNFERDTEYWNRYYKLNPPKTQKPSQFAEFVQNYLEPNKKMIDLGCGNGRDSLFFAEKKIFVTGIDAADEVVHMLNCVNELENANFVCDDFVHAKLMIEEHYDYCYSRFTLHAIDEIQEQDLLKNVFNTLNLGGMLFIEARTIHDDIYGKGEQVDRNSFIYNNHFRRFVEKEELTEKMKKIGFTVLYVEERKGFAVSKESDPVLLRIIAKK